MILTWEFLVVLLNLAKQERGHSYFFLTLQIGKYHQSNARKGYRMQSDACSYVKSGVMRRTKSNWCVDYYLSSACFLYSLILLY